MEHREKIIQIFKKPLRI